MDPVQIEPTTTAPKADTVTPGPAEGFTKVPHSLLRGDCRFGEPLDFMVYLHLFTYSHGFGRREADMSQAQLGRFTGAAKNTIKRSLDRLIAQGWIKCTQEFECARTSRRWLVVTPEDRGGKPGPKGKRTVSKSDSVKTEPGPTLTGSGSTADTLTGSKNAPYLETDPKEKSKNSLAPETPTLRSYFAAVKPFGKRQSEWRAYQGLRHDYGEEQIAACVEHLTEKGIPISGAPCHSPMGFLSKAMGQVWEEVQIVLNQRAKEMARAKAIAEADAAVRIENEAAERETRIREEAFHRAYPSHEARADAISRYAARFPILGSNGPALRNLAISAWWQDCAQSADNIEISNGMAV